MSGDDPRKDPPGVAPDDDWGDGFTAADGDSVKDRAPEALDDEAPPKVPEIEAQSEPGPMGSVAPFSVGDGAAASSQGTRRLAPPPKPRGEGESAASPSLPPVSEAGQMSKPPRKLAPPPKPVVEASEDDLVMSEDDGLDDAIGAAVNEAARRESQARSQPPPPRPPRPSSKPPPADAQTSLSPPPVPRPDNGLRPASSGSEESPGTASSAPPTARATRDAERAVAPAAVSAPPRPAVSVPPAPEVPRPETGALVRPPPSLPIPDDEVPAKSSERSHVAVMAMRIISVGTPSEDDEEPPEILNEIESLPAEASQPEAEAPSPTSEGDAEYLPDEDIAPESGEAELDEAEELSADDAQPLPSDPDAAKKPPPPPRRGVTPPPPPSDASKKRVARGKRKREPKPVRPQRSPWWEELFSEDFIRAHAPLKSEQIVREVDFIEQSLGVAPGGIVLDLGCGQGQHAVELASRGFGVVGYDLSLFQLALAADVAQERGQKLNFLQGDMREMAFEEMFDGIYCWDATFGYFEEEKNVAVAERIFHALRPGGALLLDIPNRDNVLVSQPSSVWYEGDSCVCMDDMTVDFITSRMKVKRSLILDDGRTRETYYSIRLYSLHEIGKLLHDVGFRVTQASGDPATPGKFFGERSPRIIMLAHRPT